MIRRLFRGLFIAVSAVVPAACVLAGVASATPAEGDVVRTDLAKGTTDAPVSIVTDGAETTLYVQHLTVRPGASSGWHAHPGPEYSVITKGSLVVQSAADCAPVMYEQGAAVFFPAGVAHVVANRGTADAEAVVTYTLPAELTVRDDSPDVCDK